jgi:hypothetical protein
MMMMMTMKGHFLLSFSQPQLNTCIRHNHAVISSRRALPAALPLSPSWSRRRSAGNNPNPTQAPPLSAILFPTLNPFSSIFFPTPQSHSSQQNTPSLRVTMVVPPDAFVGPNPQVGWWNENKREWDTDGITEISFDSETRRLTFASVRMTALSLVQSRVVSLPCVLSTPSNTTVYPY